MDPNATLAAFLASLEDGDPATALDAAEALTDWLRRGGFMPAPIEWRLSDPRETSPDRVTRPTQAGATSMET